MRRPPLQRVTRSQKRPSQTAVSRQPISCTSLLPAGSSRRMEAASVSARAAQPVASAGRLRASRLSLAPASQPARLRSRLVKQGGRGVAGTIHSSAPLVAKRNRLSDTIGAGHQHRLKPVPPGANLALDSRSVCEPLSFNPRALNPEMLSAFRTL